MAKLSLPFGAVAYLLLFHYENFASLCTLRVDALQDIPFGADINDFTVIIHQDLLRQGKSDYFLTRYSESIDCRAISIIPHVSTLAKIIRTFQLIKITSKYRVSACVRNLGIV